MASQGEDFQAWLTERLDAAGTDGEVFSGYISGTLSSLEGAEASEVEESLLEILQGCLEDADVCSAVCRDILEKWNEECEKCRIKKAAGPPVVIAAASSESTSGAEAFKGDSKVAANVGMSNEEKKRLLDQYGCEFEEEEEDVTDSVGKSTGYVNHNTSIVSDAQKLHRELMKADHEAKLERDRKGREEQSQKAQDRKEKEKKRTQKHEKRR